MIKKKGFSLVELIAVVVILAVVIGIGVTVFINVRKNVLNNQYENIKSRIEDAAIDYANDTQIITVSVGKLIEEGYLTPDDNEAVYNPIDKSSLNCKIVEVTLNNGIYDAVLTNNGELENGSCSEYDISVASLIDITCYSETNDENEIKKCQDTFANTNNTWYSGSIKLSLDEKITKTVSDYRWQGLTGEASNESEIKVTADSVKSTTFSVSVTYEDGSSETSSTVVQIDNQKPLIIDIVKNDNWSKGSKDVSINATDSNGSGIESYYVGTSDTCDGEFKTSNKYKLESGKYYACVKDKAGNISDVSSFEIINIDNTKPEIKKQDGKFFVTNSEVKGITYYSELSRKVIFEDNESGISAIKYCFTNNNTCTPNKKATIKVGASSEAIFSYPANKNANRVCTIAIDSVGNETDVICDDTFLVDNTKPTKVKAEQSEDNSSYINVSGTDSESGIYKYVCHYGTSSINLNKSVLAKDGVCDLGVLSSGVTYYVNVDAYNNANLVTTSSTINFNAQVKMSDAYKEVCGSDEYCNSPLYISYSGKKFVVYRNSNGYKAIYDGIYKNYNYLQDVCCNNGNCTYNGAEYTNGLTSANLNGAFLNSLSNYSNKLVRATWNTGYDSNVSSRTATAYVGLMDYDEITSTKLKSWVHASTNGSYFWLLTPYKTSSYIHNYVASCNNSDCKLSSLIVNTLSGLRPVIVFKGSIVFTSGDGSSTNPYII